MLKEKGAQKRGGSCPNPGQTNAIIKGKLLEKLRRYAPTKGKRRNRRHRKKQEKYIGEIEELEEIEVCNKSNTRCN